MSQPSENRLITSARYALCLLTASGVLLSGCASSGVGSVAQTTRAEYYPSCYEPVSHLRSTVEINRSVAYAKSAQSCYQSQFKALLDGRKNKSINEAEGRKRLAEIVSGLQETNALLVAANGRAGENINNYTQAYEKDLQQVGVPRTEVTKVAEAENRASTTKGGSKPKTGSNPKVPKEAVATEQTIRKAQDAQSEGNKVASRGQGMIQEVCNSPDMGDWAPPSCAKA